MIPKVRPKIELLGKSFIEKIIQEALLLLEKEGVFIENEEASRLLQDAGMNCDKGKKRFFITRGLVQKCLDSTPSSVSLFDRSGEKEFVLGRDNVHFDPGSAAVSVLDHKTRRQRIPVTRDLVRFSRLTDSLEHFHFQSTGIISSDVPDLIADSYRLYIALQFSAKPVITGTFRIEGFRPMLDMLLAVRGNAKNLAQKPLAIFDACPSPPLKWSNLTTQSLIDCAKNGIPSELISMGLTGATSPVTIGGTLVQHTAENLSGLVICQLAQKGAPVIFGGSPSSFDMRRGTTPMGAIETMMIDCAYSQIGKYLGLPTHAYMGLSDTKVNDSQAGLESGMGVLLAALAGINVVSGAGMMDFESCQSLEKLVIDHEICGMAYRLIQGIEQRDEPLALNLFQGFTPETQFLSMPHTRQWYRQEQFFPDIIDRDTYDTWVGKGEKDASERARDRVEDILNNKPPNRIKEDIQKKLHGIMQTDASRNGLDSLPPADL
ncbi:MAG: trimethylamine methyltransferase family protein [Candidatus Aminicenantes bacterium]|nr:trimethylamine methyltransferase family protein [Candidatus Aminicenantes bacterium]